MIHKIAIGLIHKIAFNLIHKGATSLSDLCDNHIDMQG